jgi:hypothetical protein
MQLWGVIQRKEMSARICGKMLISCPVYSVCLSNVKKWSFLGGLEDGLDDGCVKIKTLGESLKYRHIY